MNLSSASASLEGSQLVAVLRVPREHTSADAAAPGSAHRPAQGDRVELSPEAITAMKADAAAENVAEDAGHATAGHRELSSEEQAEVDRLRDRDVEVRAHEQAHAARGGHHAGAPQYEYEMGPDGQRYAVGGKVSIDTAAVQGDPEATLRKMETVRAAANAPAEPSSQDRAVAAEAARTEQKARAELAEEGQAQARVEAPHAEETSSAAAMGQPVDPQREALLSPPGHVGHRVGSSLRAYQAHA